MHQYLVLSALLLVRGATSHAQAGQCHEKLLSGEEELQPEGGSAMLQRNTVAKAPSHVVEERVVVTRVYSNGDKQESETESKKDETKDSEEAAENEEQWSGEETARTVDDTATPRKDKEEASETRASEKFDGDGRMASMASEARTSGKFDGDGRMASMENEARYSEKFDGDGVETQDDREAKSEDEEAGASRAKVERKEMKVEDEQTFDADNHYAEEEEQEGVEEDGESQEDETLEGRTKDSAEEEDETAQQDMPTKILSRQEIPGKILSKQDMPPKIIDKETRFFEDHSEGSDVVGDAADPAVAKKPMKTSFFSLQRGSPSRKSVAKKPVTKKRVAKKSARTGSRPRKVAGIQKIVEVVTPPIKNPRKAGPKFGPLGHRKLDGDTSMEDVIKNPKNYDVKQASIEGDTEVGKSKGHRDDMNPVRDAKATHEQDEDDNNDHKPGSPCRRNAGCPGGN